jgi:hypothetical protein
MTTIRNGSNGCNGTPFDPTVRECRVCIHAGKPYDECITHWVKDRSGNITCPTLLSQKCLLCGTCGHTASYCKSKIGGDVASTTTPATTSTKPTKPTKPAQVAQPRPASSNRYALLGLIDQEKEQCDATFPLLDKKPDPSPAPSSAQTAQAAPTAATSWASRLTSPPPPPYSIPISVNTGRGRVKAARIAVSWADQSDGM